MSVISNKLWRKALLIVFALGSALQLAITATPMFAAGVSGEAPPATPESALVRQIRAGLSAGRSDWRTGLEGALSQIHDTAVATPAVVPTRAAPVMVGAETAESDATAWATAALPPATATSDHPAPGAPTTVTAPPGGAPNNPVPSQAPATSGAPTATGAPSADAALLRPADGGAGSGGLPVFDAWTR